ncbi:glycosyltransferase [Jatrophihabitans sp. DSM 44399]|uniref:Glycosyltransferase n=1 Tax=Jatrophihabitans lederbergiae TaxID=3075547 RepID=A0ABU2J9E2_9ACTN|nr:glycosyltransferase [Jatrophihabitans sp. DSM 44399]MDT0261601.1 glycosyltransferase [Jatrophihabitans sp. DSM 44399]
MQRRCSTRFSGRSRFGLVMIEALATGTPVVATACGSAPEIIEHLRLYTELTGQSVRSSVRPTRAVASTALGGAA